MPAVSGVWSCLHYPVPRGGFSPPGLGCFSVCVGLIVNPKCTRETTAVISPTLAPHYVMPSSLEKILSGGGSQDTLNTFLSLFPFCFLLLPVSLSSSISEYQQGLRQHKCHAVRCPAGCTALVTQLFGILCARETVPMCRSCRPSPCKLFITFIKGKTPLI